MRLILVIPLLGGWWLATACGAGPSTPRPAQARVATDFATEVTVFSAEGAVVREGLRADRGYFAWVDTDTVALTAQFGAESWIAAAAAPGEGIVPMAALASIWADTRGAVAIGGEEPQIVDLDTGRTARLPLSAPPTFLSWAPNGARLAAGNAEALVVLRRDGSVVTTTRPAGSPAEVVWSPEGDRVVLLASPTASAPGEVAVLRAASDAELISLAVYEAGATVHLAASFSPGGDRVALAETIVGEALASHLLVSDWDGLVGPTRLAFDVGTQREEVFLRGVAWSPDGDRLAVWGASRGSAAAAGDAILWMVDVRAARPRELWRGPGPDAHVVWLDGSTLAVTPADEGTAVGAATILDAETGRKLRGRDPSPAADTSRFRIDGEGVWLTTDAGERLVRSADGFMMRVVEEPVSGKFAVLRSQPANTVAHYRISADGSRWEPLAILVDPAFPLERRRDPRSPDGSWTVVARDGGLGLVGAGGETRAVAPVGSPRSVVWGPDGSAFAFEPRPGVIAAAAVDGGVRELVVGNAVRLVDWDAGGVVYAVVTAGIAD